MKKERRVKQNGYDERGREVGDPKPVATPAGFRRPPTLQEQIRSLVRHENYQKLVDSGEIESFEDADDFDVDDDVPMLTPYENSADEQDLRNAYRHEAAEFRREREEQLNLEKFAIASGKAKPKRKPKPPPKDKAKVDAPED